MDSEKRIREIIESDMSEFEMLKAWAKEIGHWRIVAGVDRFLACKQSIELTAPGGLNELR